MKGPALRFGGPPPGHIPDRLTQGARLNAALSEGAAFPRFRVTQAAFRTCNPAACEFDLAQCRLPPARYCAGINHGGFFLDVPHPA